MITAFYIVRFLKFLAVMALSAGTVGAFLPAAWADRRRAARLLAAPGFFATWILGVVMLTLLERSLLSQFVLGAAACSFISINAVMWSSAKEARRTPAAAAVAVLGLVGALAFMVWRR